MGPAVHQQVPMVNPPVGMGLSPRPRSGFVRLCYGLPGNARTGLINGATQMTNESNAAEVLGGSSGDLLERADLFRIDACRNLDPAGRAAKGQFMTPPSIARFMAGMFSAVPSSIRVLDAGAGVGVLSAALVSTLCGRPSPPSNIAVTAWEVDNALVGYLRSTLTGCETAVLKKGIAFNATIHHEDFLAAAASMLGGGLFASVRPSFNCAILNPPYHKIHSDSAARQQLRAMGLETTNLYTAFLSVAMELLEPGGELVAITPRSFCNGPYFRPFRERFLTAMSLRRIHVFETRDRAFGGDGVLQETVILHAVKDRKPPATIVVSSSEGPDDECPTLRHVAPELVVRGADSARVIHIVADELGGRVAERVSGLHTSLADLGVQVSTGRVVDFRASEFLRDGPDSTTVPLIYPGHLVEGRVRWPKTSGKKPNALVATQDTDRLLLASGYYVLVKRFSAKEESRRIVAALFDPTVIVAPRVAIENHLNVLHLANAGLPQDLARGLVAWLNSSLVDAHFRQWSGHTQVNAADLRGMVYPSRADLASLGASVGDQPMTQDLLDQHIERNIFTVVDASNKLDPVAARKRIREAMVALRDLGLPREQQNERSALTLLALLDLRPGAPWSTAMAPLRGITPMMTFFTEQYGKTYAPNTRETVRRFTVHQFLDAGIVLRNPDNPARPTNSPDAVYQIAPDALALLHAFGTAGWADKLSAWLGTVETLAKRYAQERHMALLPVQIAPNTTINLSPGGQNDLVKKILEEFCQRFTPGGHALYVGDTSAKWAYFDKDGLTALGVTVDAHGKMPDVVIHHKTLNWLVLVEAVTSHGPVNAKRRGELKSLFDGSTAGLVFVTAFLDRHAMVKYLGEISWETEVWVADAPSHMIHFNGERFLGPY